MDKQAVAQRLQSLATNNEKRSKAAQLRDVLDEVEKALAAGAKRADVLAELNTQGLHMSLSTFETTLKRLRARRHRESARLFDARPDTARSTVSASQTTRPQEPIKTVDQPSHDPTDLDRIIAAQPDLSALARLAKRSKK